MYNEDGALGGESHTKFQKDSEKCRNRVIFTDKITQLEIKPFYQQLFLSREVIRVSPHGAGAFTARPLEPTAGKDYLRESKNENEMS